MQSRIMISEHIHNLQKSGLMCVKGNYKYSQPTEYCTRSQVIVQATQQNKATDLLNQTAKYPNHKMKLYQQIRVCNQVINSQVYFKEYTEICIIKRRSS